jgi:hypothetical protein
MVIFYNFFYKKKDILLRRKILSLSLSFGTPRKKKKKEGDCVVNELHVCFD